LFLVIFSTFLFDREYAYGNPTGIPEVNSLTTLKKKGAHMEVKDYCKAMLAEVNAWKNKLDAMKKTADAYSTEQKEKVLPLIGQLEQEVTTAQMRVDQLEKECPSDWSPMKNDLDDLFGTVGSKVNRAWKDLEGGNVGG
jgi:phage-related tail protein